ncbi:MAG TPA: hypothetical protein VLL49_01355, partial [Anaerolineales bacterium]|nr:hypothetical protein [Anaerolineales bacterium]
MVALIATVVFFVVFLGVLHPGYAINDDIKIIAIAAGYPDVAASPFLIFSNVLLGFLLVPLYKLPTAINWEIALFLTVDMIAAWTLLYFVVSASTPRFYRVMGMVLLLACLSYYPLQITFTSTAALACFTGLFAVLAGASAPKEPSRAIMALGSALIFVGSLIRLQALALAVPPVLAGALVLSRAIRIRPAIFALGCAGILVFGGYAVDRLYVRAHPKWNSVYRYQRTAAAIHDSHRLENLGLEIRRISWSNNDQELFARWWYPDPRTFSVERLQYLVKHVSGISNSPMLVWDAFITRIAASRAGWALIFPASSWLLMLALSTSTNARWAIPLITTTALAENLALMWLYKNPDYVLFSSMSNAAILAILAAFLAGGEVARARSL